MTRGPLWAPKGTRVTISETCPIRGRVGVLNDTMVMEGVVPNQTMALRSKFIPVSATGVATDPLDGRRMKIRGGSPVPPPPPPDPVVTVKAIGFEVC